MSKVFKRPMFRKGGQVNEGIMTGIVDREQYQTGTPDPFIGETDQFPYMAKPTGSSPQMNVPDLKTMTKENIDLLLEAAGDRGGFDPLTQFLLQYGPAAAKQTGGGTFANLIAAAEKPVARLIASRQREDDFLRSIRTQATGAAMKRRSELEQADIDNRFREKLADKQISSNQEIALKQN
jgi:antitoxin (DNA-binding transcriptional repressor) of toxin-antitoxin stability system